MSHTFIRWFRQGLSAAIDPSVITFPQTGARARFDINAEIGAAGIQSQIATTAIEVLGPGDISGLDHRQIVRTFPVEGTLDFEPEFFAHVELKRPDLPWLFTPIPTNTAPDALPTGWVTPPYRKQNTVVPWLCLAVIPLRDGVTLEPGAPPLLKIATGAGAELPLLDEIHAWTHVQISGDASAGAATIIASEAHRMLSRLVCPRRLEPRTSYIACVVPAFKAGREGGLGKTITANTPGEPAWAAGDATVELPVFFHWTFSTGDGGDFKSLVTRLVSRPDLPGVGTRPVDITSPGSGLPDRTAAASIALGGALQVTVPAAVPIDAPIATQLPPTLNATDTVVPPIYGRWLAAATQVSTTPPTPLGWLDALNIDPRYRIAAGLGTRVVQDRQEDLMAAIWDQFAEIIRANQLLRQAQLAVAASERIVAHHLAPLPDAVLLAVAGPALGRIRVANQRTARKAVRDSCLPLFALSGAFRRILRTRGPIERRFARQQGPASLPDQRQLTQPGLDEKSILERLASGQLRLRTAPAPDGAILAPFQIDPPRGGRPVPPEIPADILTALTQLKRRVRPDNCVALPVGSVAGTIRNAIAPGVAIDARVRVQIALPAGVAISPRLDPIMVAPEIPTPMINPLQELGQDWLLPGLSAVPANTVSIVEPNRAFIEAYMVGLNHEMGRELLWRGFPTDQRGTIFSKFWDRRGCVSTANTPIPARDIEPIHTWKAATALGSSLAAEGTDLIVLLIRGEFLQRYPRATIFMQRARWKRDARGRVVLDGKLAQREPVPLSANTTSWAADTRFPVLSGRLGEDVSFLGFPLSRRTVRGRSPIDVPSRRVGKGDDAGWFVVFQEQPTEPRFGFSDDGPATVDEWDHLSWSQIVTTSPSVVTPDGLTRASGYVKVAETSTTYAHAELPLQPVWDGRSDALAVIALRRAFRLYVHATDLVAEK
jgi:hypothetical protein